MTKVLRQGWTVVARGKLSTVMCCDVVPRKGRPINGLFYRRNIHQVVGPTD
jgi:hypothetical protein